MDKEIVCACGETFIFTEGEQNFYESRGFEPPKRCGKCRREKKRRYND